jgi:iron complex outermembrane receptor protein
MKIHGLWLGASLVTLAWCSAAAAQTTATRGAAAAPAATSDNQVAEVVVTADRRTTNLQTTAIAATVLSQDELQRQNVTSVDELQFISPSLAVNNFGQGNNIDIRGIGKGEHNSQTTTGVITYRDSLATFPGYIQEEPYYDVANVEILRGPQGTFSGQNATGGALIVQTQDPIIDGGYTGYVRAHYGNYNDVGAEGAVNLPISDTLAARVAFYTQHRDTFYNLTGLTKGDPDLNWGAMRLSVLWRPVDALKVVAKVDYGYLDNGGYFGDPMATKGTDHLFDIGYNGKSYALDTYLRAGLRADYTFVDGITFRSVTGYQYGRSGWKGDIDGTPVDAVRINEVVPVTIWSQEFNLISPTDKPLSWILGAYYSHSDYEFPYFDITSGGLNIDLIGQNLTHTYAAFGQVSYKLPHGFELQAGLRYSTWSTTNNGLYYIPQFGHLLDQTQHETETGDNVTGKVTLNWDIDEHNFAYAFVATGAKPGGLNTSLYAFPQVPIPAPFKQEYVTDYEVGWKSSMLDNHLRTQIGFYYNNFEHFQVIIPLPNDPIHTTEQNNPSKTVLYGFEASAQAVVGNLTVNANVGIEKSKLGTVYIYDPRLAAAGIPAPKPGACDLGTGPAAPNCTNLEGHPQTYAPDLTFNLAAHYDVLLDGGDVLTPSANFSYISGQWATLFDNPAAGDHLGPRQILGASLTWTHGPLQVMAYGTNLTDRRYISATVSPLRLAGAPRQYGISVMRRF